MARSRSGSAERPTSGPSTRRSRADSQPSSTAAPFPTPWDVAPNGTTVRMLAEAPGDHTPFYFPEAEGTVSLGQPRAGVLARQDWSRTYAGPVNTGEVIHVFAAGFGP